MTPKKELAVAALRDGTVIDHIPSRALFKCVKILGLENMASQLTIGNNLHSSKWDSKGIIKVADVFFPEKTLNRIALLAPNAVINTIREFAVTEKRPVVLPETIVGIVKCDNPKCITNNEPMKTRFSVISREPVVLKCHYCNHSIKAEKATIL
ncbi:MAG: aspartate carbamoyltransferase regulatory subunit [Muribaculaceae bacterium]|nr:aspartate carbamoyltransferase regulatory subunit [Muribaculaceae bacterium]